MVFVQQQAWFCSCTPPKQLSPFSGITPKSLLTRVRVGVTPAHVPSGWSGIRWITAEPRHSHAHRTCRRHHTRLRTRSRLIQLPDVAVELDLMEFLQQVSIDPFNSSMDLAGYNATVNMLLFENPSINTTISLVPHKQKKSISTNRKWPVGSFNIQDIHSVIWWEMGHKQVLSKIIPPNPWKITHSCTFSHLKLSRNC